MQVMPRNSNLPQTMFTASEYKLVADNVDNKFADEVIANLKEIPRGSGMLFFEGDRYITREVFTGITIKPEDISMQLTWILCSNLFI